MLVSGSSDNTIRLWDVCTGECLSLVSLIYPLDLVLKKTGENFSLWAATDGAIYHFNIKSIQSKLTFVLLGSIGSDTGLTRDKLSLNNFVNLSQENTRLLIQRGAINHFQDEYREGYILNSFSK